MLKKLITLALSLVLLTSCFMPLSVDATNNEIMVVDVTDPVTIAVSGLTANTVFKYEAANSLCWSGTAFNKTVKLNTVSDWHGYSYLEFWVYATKESYSSFGLAAFSDNAQTKFIDYYDTVVFVRNKGWNLISIPLSRLNAVHSPVGLDSISHIELWPVYGGRGVDPSVVLYIDNMYVRKTATTVTPEAVVSPVGDITTRADIKASGVIGQSINYSIAKAPNKNTYAIHLTDNKTSSALSSGSMAEGLNFNTLNVTDVTGYNTIELSMYSETASNDTIRVVLWSDDPAQESNDYYYADVLLDWNGWEKVQIPLDTMRVAGSPLGKDEIKAIRFWWYESDKSVNSGIYLDGITLKNVDYNARWESPIYLAAAPVVENQIDVAAKIKALYPQNKHPRLITTQTEIDWIKANYQNDDYLKVAVPSFLNNYCAGYKNSMPSATSATAIANQAASMALAYHLTEDAGYKEACWRNMLALTKSAVSWTPDSSNLTLGDTSRAVAVTYDLMYNFWTEEQRMIVRNAMILYALEPMRANLLRENGGDAQATNWNPIINSGLGMCALALADTPGYEVATNQYINRLHLALRKYFEQFNPDGSAFEGLDYWSYAMDNYLAYEKALYNSLQNSENATDKTDYFKFSMLDEFGMENSFEFVEHMHGLTGRSFNYYDGRARDCSTTGDFFAAKLFNSPEMAGIAYEAKAPTTYGILLYEPSLDYSNWRNNMPLDAVYNEGKVQAGAMRTSWEKNNNGFYVGYKGNNENGASHGRLDAGAFVLEALGKRWISLPSNEDYNLDAMFGSKRYQYYRNRAEGSNTLVIGPGVHQGSATANDSQASTESLLDQKKLSTALIEQSKTAINASKGAYSILNLTDAYSATADSAKRGLALVNNRNAFLLQDEIDVKSACDVYSFLHMSKDITVTVAQDGKSATLAWGSDTLKVTLLSDCSATLQLMEAAPLSTSPNVQSTDNSSLQKLAVKASSVNDKATFALLITSASSSFTIDTIVPLNQWDAFLQ